MKRRDLLTSGSLSIAASLVPRFVQSATPCPSPLLTVDSGNPVTASCAQGPLYAAAMGPYQVKALSGVLSPTNGKATLQSVTPAEWQNSDPGTNGGNVIDFWSGGIGDSSGGKLYIVGGGHNNSANNGLYSYDFNGAVAPAGASVLTGSQSTIANVPTSVTTYTSYNDGKASSRHTYDGVAFVDGKVYVIGGSHYRSGYFAPFDTWKFVAGAWTQLPNAPISNVERPVTVLDPVSKKILAWRAGGSQYAFLNTNNDTWGSAKSMGTSYPVMDVTMAYDTLRKRVAIFGGGVNGVWTIDWNSETVTSVATHSVSAIMDVEGITSLYDPSRDVYWLFGGRGASGGSGYSTLHEVNASNFGVTPHAMSGDSIAVSSNNWGSFKRAVLLDSAIGFVSGFNSPAYIIKLP